MQRRLLVLLGVAGLLVFASADPSGDLAAPVRKQVGQGKAVAPVPSNPTEANGTVLPNGIDVNQVIREVQRGQRPEPPPRPLGNPFTGAEFMPAPMIEPDTQWNPAVCYDGTNYLVVWAARSTDGDYDIYGARFSTAGTLLDVNGILICGDAHTQGSPAVVYATGNNSLVVWQDNRNDNWDIYGIRVNSSGGLVGSEIRVTTNTSDQQSPAVAFGHYNTTGLDYYYVAWQDNRNGNWDIFGTRVSMTGTVMEDIQMLAYATDQTAPAVAYGGVSIGTFIVVWQDYRGGYCDINSCRVSHQTGAVVGDQAMVSQATNDQTSPSVTFSGGYYLVVWQDSRNGNDDIYGARVTTSGVVQETGGIAVSTATNNQRTPVAAYDGTNYCVAWQDYQSGSTWDIYAQRVNTAGVLQGSTILVSNATSDQQLPAVAFGGTSPNNNYFVVWQDYRNGGWDIFGGRVSTAGSPRDGSGVCLTPFVNAQTSAAVAFDGTNYLVVWQDDANSGVTTYYDIWGARVTKSGSVLDAAGFVISSNTPTSNQNSPSVAFDGTNYLVVWQDNRGPSIDIYGARVSKAGEVQDPNGISISTAASVQQNVSVAFDATSSNYFVVWQDGRNYGATRYDIYGARVRTDGTVIETDGLPISTASDDQQLPSVAFSGTDYLVVWQDRRSSSSWDIYGARVRTDGTVIETGGIPISTATGFQYWPDVAFDGAGYLVVWHDARNSGTTGWDIYGARVRTDGTVIETGGIPISTATNDQQASSVAFDGTNYLVVWYDTRNGISNGDIYGRQVSRAGQVGEECAISTQSTLQAFPDVACGEGTVLVAYESITNISGGVNYAGKNRILARLGTLPWTADVGVDSILRPVASFLWFDGVHYSRPIPPMVRFKNYGSEASIPFNVRLTVSPGTYSCTKTVPSLAADATCLVEFDSIVLTTGAFTAKCSTMLYADQRAGNNALSSCFQGCTFVHFSDLTHDTLYKDPSSRWVLGPPQSPWTLPPMDAKAWGNRLSGHYGSNENSYLTSPTYKALQDNPAIAFQHSFRSETLADGGNFEYKPITGSDWFRPRISAGLPYNSAPFVLGDSGWSGNSGGWKQSVFTIPVTNNTQFKVRWHFAADGDANTSNGWLIDEVAGVGCDTLPRTDRPPQPGDSIIATLDFWPNPARGDGQLSYTLLKDCEVSIKLYDITGALVKRVAYGRIKPGMHTAKMDVSKLASGIYFVKAEGAGDVSTTKVIIE